MLSRQKEGMVRIFLVILIVLAATGGLVVFNRNNVNAPTLETSFFDKIVNPASPTPDKTPIPFAELTIPGLRERSYKSALGELRKYSENASYTSYLTNYDSDGLKIEGLLTIPKNNISKHPAIVFVHGYIAPTIYRTTERYNDYVNYLARNGFVVFKIDLRGHGESDGDPGGAYYSSDYVVDTLNAYAALESSDFVDPTKIGMWGHSMAGNVTFRSFVAKKTIPAVAIWAGAGYTYTDLREYRIMDNSYRPPQQNTEVQRKRQELGELYGDFDASSSFWKQVVPTNYLDGVSGAVELHHAVNDTVVSVEYSRNLAKVLKGSAISNEVFEYPSGGHNLDGSSFTQAMQRTVEFFKTNL